jgi:hypothetical protein
MALRRMGVARVLGTKNRMYVGVGFKHVLPLTQIEVLCHKIN